MLCGTVDYSREYVDLDDFPRWHRRGKRWMVTEERGGWEFNGSGGRGKGKRASERAGRRDHGGEKRKRMATCFAPCSAKDHVLS